MSVASPPPADRSARGERRPARADARARCGARRFIVGATVILFWVSARILGDHITPVRPALRPDARHLERASVDRALVRNRPARSRRLLARPRRLAGHPPHRAARDAARHARRDDRSGSITGYFRGIADDTISRVIDAVLAIPLIVLAVTVVAALGSRPTWTVIVVIAIVFSPIIARTVRAAVLGEAQLDYVEAARLRGERLAVRDVLGGPPERHAADPRRGDDPARLRDLRGRDAHVHRLRTAAAVAGLGRSDRGQLPGPRGFSGGRCSSRRSRSPRSSSRSTSSRTRSSRCSSDERHCRRSSLARARRRLHASAESTVPCSAASRSRSAAASRTGSSASRAAGSRPRRSRSSATSRGTDASSGGSISVAGRDVLGARRRRAARVPRRDRLDGLPEPRRRAEPVDPGRRRRSPRRSPCSARRRATATRASSRGARARADRRPGLGDGALPAPALGRHAAARRDRDGAREGSGAPHPRRADDRSRRDGRGRGARPRLAAPGASSTRRCCSSATTSGSSRRCARASACSTPAGSSRRGRSTPCCATRATRTRSACCAASRAAACARTTAASTRSPASCRALGADLPGCVFADRCALADERCHAEEPPLITIEGGHESRCWYHERAPQLPREEAADLELAGVDRAAAPLVESTSSRKVFKQRGHEVHALDGGERGDLARRDARPRRRVGKRQDDARPDAARDRRRRRPAAALLEGGPLPATLPEALARGAAGAADRVPEPRLGAQPAPLGAPDPAPLAEEARRGQRCGGGATRAGPRRSACG